ncbi:hypothetical protein F8538_09340 [Edwardsiella ictaluri]|nr:hypothetical protein [Edwardsiella ictaluri]QPW26984.1 hypothetical protein F8538_09340 [Edwardsiella ictaluri]
MTTAVPTNTDSKIIYDSVSARFISLGHARCQSAGMGSSPCQTETRLSLR